MQTIEKRINTLLEGDKNPDETLLKRIQMILLWDTNQNIPLTTIKECAKNV